MPTRYILANRWWPTIVVVVMMAAYVLCITNGRSVASGLMTAEWTGMFIFLFAFLIAKEWGERYRMDNWIALWTTLLMVVAPVAPSALTPSPPQPLLVSVGILFVAVAVIAAIASAYLLQRLIVGERRNFWYAQNALLPFGLFWSSALEVSGQHVPAAFTLFVWWFLHFFFEKMPQWKDRLGILP